jgi:hypothetical protein
VDCNTGLAWLGFWIFAAVFIACDHWIYSLGHNSLLQYHKTPEEKELQQLRLKEKRLDLLERYRAISKKKAEQQK